ncbi:alpha/beta fold hydrolase [Azohydromonas caseinilytica]|uniref:Alpha/beta fold hydrolase n=1 Tax=Azohydromonas caseinilytica TaxID=2728836 RepID=A0A848F6G4_9BURK|nr:alpha/beta fold hydrolase [Azohydromonas caseinilytica]NML14159.1 alpha/beta fold hydrolase [Azohydromonas caseinilytica]
MSASAWRRTSSPPPERSLRARLLRLVGLTLMAGAAAAAWWRAPEWPVQTLVERWGMPPSTFVELQGAAVHLRDEGPLQDSAPLLLLHGVGGSLHDWEPWAQALKASHRVIRLDLPGNGLSDAAPGDDYRSETEARRMLALLDQLGVARVRVVGHGRGGEVAVQMALLAPRRVQRLLLVAAAPLAAEVLPPVLRLAPSLPWPQWVVSSMLPGPLVTGALQSLYADPSRLTPEQVERRLVLLRREGNRWALLQQWRQDQSTADADATFARLRLPVLLLWGEADALAPPAQARALQQKIPGSRLQLLDGVGHLPQEEAPARSLAAAQGFIEGR